MAASSALAVSAASRVRRTAACAVRAAGSGDESGPAGRRTAAAQALAVVVVSGSQGGVSSAQYALAVPARLVVFNDAGIGKDGAGGRVSRLNAAALALGIAAGDGLQQAIHKAQGPAEAGP